MPYIAKYCFQSILFNLNSLIKNGSKPCKTNFCCIYMPKLEKFVFREEANLNLVRKALIRLLFFSRKAVVSVIILTQINCCVRKVFWVPRHFLEVLFLFHALILLKTGDEEYSLLPNWQGVQFASGNQ